ASLFVSDHIKPSHFAIPLIDPRQSEAFHETRNRLTITTGNERADGLARHPRISHLYPPAIAACRLQITKQGVGGREEPYRRQVRLQLGAKRHDRVVALLDKGDAGAR